MTYLLVILLLLYLSAKYDLSNIPYNQEKKNKTFWWICVLFILIAGLRYQIGGDTTDGYAPEYPSFSKFGSSSWLLDLYDSRYQPGWFLFESICRSISPNFLFPQFIHALFINTVFFWFIKKYSKYWFVPVLVYAVTGFLKLDTEVLRESAAVAFGLLAYDRRIEKQYVFMIIYAFAAYMFHVSGITVVILLLLSLVKDTKWTRLATLGISMILVFGFSSMDISATLFDLFFNEGQVNTYFSQELRYSYSFLGWALYYIKTLVFPLAVLCFLPCDSSTRGHTNIMYIVYFSLMILSSYSLAFNRFADFLMPFSWIVLSEFCVIIVHKNRGQFSKLTLIGICLILFYINQSHLFYLDNYSKSSYKMTYDRYYPYRSVLEEDNTYK